MRIFYFHSISHLFMVAIRAVISPLKLILALVIVTLYLLHDVKSNEQVADIIACTNNSCNGGGWSSWSLWSECSALCGGGRQNRTRQCQNEEKCSGMFWQESVCNLMPCINWGDWSSWSSCTVTCGSGQRIRSRSCPIPNGCNSSVEYETNSTCNLNPCSHWSEWASWGSCSKTCGPGNRERTRQCLPVSDTCLGSAKNIEPCYEKVCPLKTEWSHWSPCTKSCDGGMKTRSMVKCPAGPPVCPIAEETAKCEEQPCPQWTTWLPWIECSKTCAGGTRVRSRSCPIVNGCVGRNYEIDRNKCNNFPCPPKKITKEPATN